MHEGHRASMCTQQVSFPDAGFSFESRACNDISFRQHTSHHHGTTQRHFWQGLGGEPWAWGGRGIALDTFMGEVHAPLLLSCPPPPSSSLSPAVFVQPPSLFTGSSKELVSLPCPAHPLPHRLISAFPLPSIKSVGKLKKHNNNNNNKNFISLPFFFRPAPTTKSASVSLGFKWNHGSEGKVPAEEVTTHWALSNSSPRRTEGLCVYETDREGGETDGTECGR